MRGLEDYDTGIAGFILIGKTVFGDPTCLKLESLPSTGT